MQISSNFQTTFTNYPNNDEEKAKKILMQTPPDKLQDVLPKLSQKPINENEIKNLEKGFSIYA